MKTIKAGDRRRTGIVLLVLLAGFLLAAPSFFLTSGYRLDVARLALYIAILAATWSLLAGVAGQFSFAHVAIAGLGAYAGAIWVRDASGWLGSVYVGIVFGTLFAWLIGTLLGLLLLRLRAAYLALFTIAFAELARLFVVAESELTGGRLSLAVQQLPGDELAHYYLVLGLLVLIVVVIYLLLRSRIGLFLRAMREDEQAAAALGVNVVRAKVLVFSVTSLMLGFGATVYTHTLSRIAPERLELLVMGQVIAVAVIGGLESPLAAAIGAVLVFGLLENLREIAFGPGALNLITAILALTVVVLGSVVMRAARGASEPVPPSIARRAWLLGMGVVLIEVFLFAVGGAEGTGLVLTWLALAVAVAAFSVFIIGSYAAGMPSWLSRVFPAIVTGSLLLVLLVRLVPMETFELDLGVWRFGVFGAILMFTLRFARNGLIYPLLQYFGGSSEAHKESVAFRDVGDVPADHEPMGEEAE